MPNAHAVAPPPPDDSARKRALTAAFTLVELAMVLVIIGLIVGGVLVGKDMIDAASVRSQISQLDKYSAAVYTFYGKYGYLPGDINSSAASQFGFTTRNGNRGNGDGNGLLEGSIGIGNMITSGENGLFWGDLATAGLIPGRFIGGSASTNSNATSLPDLLPKASIGGGNYVYVYSGGGWNGSTWNTNGINYYGLSSLTGTVNPGWNITTLNIVKVSQANNIDAKIDDGLPQTGNITAQYGGVCCGAPAWVGASDGSAVLGSATTCYDNGNTAGATQHYSTAQNGGAGTNCALSFRFQ